MNFETFDSFENFVTGWIIKRFISAQPMEVLLFNMLSSFSRMTETQKKETRVGAVGAHDRRYTRYSSGWNVD